MSSYILLGILLAINACYGNIAEWKQHPSIVSITSPRGNCTGTILSKANSNGKGVILTSAECINKLNPHDTNISIGCSGHLSSDCDAEFYAIDSFQIHDQYDTVNNNIGLVILTSNITHHDAQAITIEYDADFIVKKHPISIIGYDTNTLHQTPANLINHTNPKCDDTPTDGLCVTIPINSETPYAVNSGSPMINGINGKLIALTTSTQKYNADGTHQHPYSVGIYIADYHDWIRSQCGPKCIEDNNGHSRRLLNGGYDAQETYEDQGGSGGGSGYSSVPIGGPCAGKGDGELCYDFDGPCGRTCSADSDCCPSYQFVASGIEIGSGSGDMCDPPDVCNGKGALIVSIACPGTQCGASYGDCDNGPSFCTGVPGETCPDTVFKPDDYVCRASKGDCDKEEKCTGSSSECPEDDYEDKYTVCRAAPGLCDVEEKCTGDSAYCPNDKKKPKGEVCSASYGICAKDAVCNGYSVDCPDQYIESGTVCRKSAGDCDIEEKCDGVNAACPPDDKVDEGTVCKAGYGKCEEDAVCNGYSPMCPDNAPKPKDTPCRVSYGPCDEAEVCDGVSTECPKDYFKNSYTVCSAGMGEGCDYDAKCTGKSADCPAKKVKDSDTVCRKSGGYCDIEEKCDGVTGKCPEDKKVAPGTSCRASYGVCGEAAVCDGSSAMCPDNGFKPDSTECRASTDDKCDPAEYCTGDSADCPKDEKKPKGTSCRDSYGPCDKGAVCTKSGKCQDNGFKKDVVCGYGYGDGCDENAYCDGYNPGCPDPKVKPEGTVCRKSYGICAKDAVCDGATGKCPDDEFETGKMCKKSYGDCDKAEYCDGTGPDCPSDEFEPNTKVCRESKGDCDKEEKCTGSDAKCPDNEFEPNTKVCREEDGDCDIEEKCTGDSANCPYDKFKDEETECRGSPGNVCDPVETCNGKSPNCPDNKYTKKDIVCRASYGPCDKAETCDGNGNCPGDEFKTGGVCDYGVGDGCDEAAVCDGTGAGCPDPKVKPVDTVCRNSYGECDKKEVCDGETGKCPEDDVEDDGTVCRASYGECDIAEECDGESKDCPKDEFKGSYTVCRGAPGDVCDPEEKCTGYSASCPQDKYGLGGKMVECREKNGDCDEAEYCDGKGKCPDDEFKKSGTTCRASYGMCDKAEKCTGSSPDCPDDGAGDPVDSCSKQEGCMVVTSTPTGYGGGYKICLTWSSSDYCAKEGCISDMCVRGGAKYSDWQSDYSDKDETNCVVVDGCGSEYSAEFSIGDGEGGCSGYGVEYANWESGASGSCSPGEATVYGGGDWCDDGGAPRCNWKISMECDGGKAVADDDEMDDDAFKQNEGDDEKGVSSWIGYTISVFVGLAVIVICIAVIVYFKRKTKEGRLTEEVVVEIQDVMDQCHETAVEVQSEVQKEQITR